MASVPDYVKDAIKCGPVPKLRNWKKLKKLTDGEKVLKFAYEYLVFPEGKKIGQPLELDIFQQSFVLSVFDSPTHIDKAIHSIARRGGKTLEMAVIGLAYIIGPLAKQNTLIRSAAMTRDQAALLHRFMTLILQMSPKVPENCYRIIPSSKTIIGIMRNVEYKALSRDAKSNHGLGLYVLILDEAGQISGPQDEFLDMLFSSMGTYIDSRTFIISTQAPDDASFLSVEIDTAERDQPDNVVCHLYTSPNSDIMDEKNWHAANPSLYGGYRSIEDIRTNAKDAIRIPSKQSMFLNLFLNRRVSLKSVWLSPSVWKENKEEPDWDLFRQNGVSIGLDLSAKNDLTAICIAAKDDEGIIHCYPFAFTPLDGIEERARSDRNPYDKWVSSGQLFGVPGRSIDYDWVAQFIKVNLIDEGIHINSIEFDRWRFQEFKKACEREGLDFPEETWHEVGQGYKDMSPRIEALETALLQNKVRHGNHPIFNMGASQAIVIKDPSGNKKLDKSKSANKIDAIIAMIMACYPLVNPDNNPYEGDISWLIG